MTTTNTSAVHENGLNALNFTRRFFDQLLDNCPQDKLCEQPIDGCNHVLWQIGHMAATDNYFLSAVAGLDSTLPETWDGLFGMGSTPTRDASQYPTCEELRAAMTERRETFKTWFSQQSEADLQKSTPENLQGFAPTFGALASTLAAHEAMHIGQVQMLRKAFGLGPVMG